MANHSICQRYFAAECIEQVLSDLQLLTLISASLGGITYSRSPRKGKLCVDYYSTKGLGILAKGGGVGKTRNGVSSGLTKSSSVLEAQVFLEVCPIGPCSVVIIGAWAPGAGPLAHYL